MISTALSPPTPSPPPPWRMEEVLSAFVLAYFVAPNLVDGLLTLFYPLQRGDWHFVGIQLSSVAAWGLCLWLLARKYRGTFASALGWTFSQGWRYYLLYAALAFGAILMTIGVLTWLSQGGELAINPYDSFSPLKMRFVALLAILGAPLLEETVFRGLLQGSLRQSLGKAWGIFITALIFTVLHTLYNQAPMAQAYVLILGILLGIVRERSGSLAPGILAHLANNLLAAFNLSL